MKTMFDESGTVEGLIELLHNKIDASCSGVMIFACDANCFTPNSIDDLLTESSLSIFGGIFPEIIFENQKYDKGTVVVAFDSYNINVDIIENLSEKTTNIAFEIQSINSESFETMFVYVDAFSTTIETLINELYYEFGLESNFIGGGAGSLSFVQKPVIFTNKGLLQDAAVLASVGCKSSIGVKHGWSKIEGPFQITKSNKNIIEELDFQPAYGVYKKVVQKHSKRDLTEDNFFEIAKGYPFGISKLGGENVVRDPIRVNHNSLVCVGNVKTGDYVDILSGDVESLVNAAHSASQEALQNSINHEIMLFIDCISRVLFLQDDFQKELNSVSSSTTKMVGALTLGEIANTGKEYLEFYNKTAVVGVF